MMLRRRSGTECSGLFFLLLLLQGKNLVMGNDKKECVITLKARALEAAIGFKPPEEAKDKVEGPRRVQLTVINARHLPKMDLMGSCDPYAKLAFDGQELQTQVVKQSYDPDWNEEKVLYVS